MLPTFEPDDKLLVALRSVLSQAGPPAAMQITVVDDGSTPGRVQRLVHAADPTGRVELVAHPQRLGLAGNWNRAIALARGELVHLLHQDDLVRPGFYAAIDRGLRAAPHAGMAFCRSRIVDGEGRVLKSSSRLRWFAGLLPDWLPVIAERQRIQTPAAVVRRATYECVGGYRADLSQTLDWEMWVRIAGGHAVWYEPRCLAAYRRHAGNESARLFASGGLWPDVIRAIEIHARTLPESIRETTLRASARWHAASALRTAERLLAAGDVERAATTIVQAAPLVRMIAAAPPASDVLRKLAALRGRIARSDRRAA
jgi:glycosyltransferase involved in cell wall biosynthesis